MPDSPQRFKAPIPDNYTEKQTNKKNKTILWLNQQRRFLLCLESSHHRRWRTNWIHPKIIKGFFYFRRSPALEHHHRVKYSTQGIRITWGERSKQQCMTVLLGDSVTTLILIKCRRCPAVAALAATLMQNWCQTRSPTQAVSAAFRQNGNDQAKSECLLFFEVV